MSRDMTVVSVELFRHIDFESRLVSGLQRSDAGVPGLLFFFQLTRPTDPTSRKVFDAKRINGVWPY